MTDVPKVDVMPPVKNRYQFDYGKPGAGGGQNDPPNDAAAPGAQEPPDQHKNPDDDDENAPLNGKETLRGVKPAEVQRKGQYYHLRSGDKPEAREENFFESIFCFCCPRISILQFVVIISLVEVFLFILSCCIYGLDNAEFLAPNAHALELLGWQDSKKIKNNYELHRWFMPILLHGHLEHLAGNVVAQLYMGSGIEWGIGFGWFAFLYIITGFGGNLLSSVLSPASYGVGASTAVFGLVGFYVSYIFSNFQYMQRTGYGQIIFLVLYTLVLVLLNLNIGPGKDDHVDNWGHLGGLITGIIAGFAITEALDARDSSQPDPTPRRFTQDEYKKRPSCCKTWVCHYFCWFVLLCWFVTLLTLFYAVVDVDIQQGDIDDPDS